MKNTNKSVLHIFIVCSAIILVSCASVETMNEEASLWKGRPVFELVQQFGPAHRQEEFSDGTTMRQWISEGGKSTFGSTNVNSIFSNTITRASGARTCLLNVSSKDDKIVNLFYRVQNDTLAGHARKVCGYFRDVLQN